MPVYQASSSCFSIGVPRYASGARLDSVSALMPERRRSSRQARAVSGGRSAKPVAVRDQPRNRACNSSDMRAWAVAFQLGSRALIAADRLIRSVARRVRGHM
jgi:hypothetical protein